MVARKGLYSHMLSWLDFQKDLQEGFLALCSLWDGVLTCGHSVVSRDVLGEFWRSLGVWGGAEMGQRGGLGEGVLTQSQAGPWWWTRLM